MATDFSYNEKTVNSSGPIKPSGINQPLDPRTEVKLYADIKLIPNPYVGMIITVLEDETNSNKMTDYKVLSLKSDDLGVANSVVDRVQRYVEYLGASSSSSGTGGAGLTAEQEEQLNKIPEIEISINNINESLNTKANTSDIPTKTSKLTNDSGFLTSIPSEYVTEQEMNEAIASISSGGGVSQEDINTAVNNYLTEHPVSGTLTPEQTAAVNKVKNSVFINAESTPDNVTASDTTKVVEITQKEVNNFRIPSLTPLSYASNPIITKDIVNDYEGVTGTADPFITKKDGVYYCFFELSTGNLSTSTLGYAYSYDAITWTYGNKLSGLETRCAFPNVKLDSNGEWYMIPDTSANVDVYKAVNFPSVWKKEYTLLTGSFADTDIIKICYIYYMFTMEARNQSSN